MAAYLGVSADRIHVVKLGVNLHGHGQGRNQKRQDNPFVVGYLARICPEKGLHLLVDAFYELTRRVGSDKIRLKVAGYLGKRNELYIKRLRSQIEAWGLSGAFEYWGEIDRSQKIQFLNSLHVLSVPTTYKESKGLYVLEALANGVPVVQPRHGAFPELIAETGGGLLVDANSPRAIAEGILQLMNDKELRIQLGQQGKEVVHRAFSDDIMAEGMLAVYRKYVS
jgi:glycosyltransferase involved in cell wall biosynthesis